jgi:hypothetical protein
MHDSSGHTKRAIRFAAFEVDVCSGQFKKRNRQIKVQDLPFRLLVALLQNPEVVFHPGLASISIAPTIPSGA